MIEGWGKGLVPVPRLPDSSRFREILAWFNVPLYRFKRDIEPNIGKDHKEGRAIGARGKDDGDSQQDAPNAT